MAEPLFTVQRDQAQFLDPANVNDPHLSFTPNGSSKWIVHQISITGPSLTGTGSAMFPVELSDYAARVVTAVVDISETVYLTTYSGGADQADGTPLVVNSSEILTIRWSGNWLLAPITNPIEFKAVLLVQIVDA